MIILRILSIITILSISPMRSATMPADALQRVGWAFDGHGADGREWPSDSLRRYDLSKLYGGCVIGWYYDFGSDPRGGDDSQLDYAIHMLWGVPDRITIDSIIRNNPGDVFVIGNEPDLGSQGNMSPEKYATFYHDAYTLIKSVNGDSLVAVGGVSMVDERTIGYLSAVLEAYQSAYGEPMPIDIWTVHGYAQIPAELPAIQQQITTMRAFMAANGYSDKPLWMTEFNTTPESMAEIYNWLLTAQNGDGMPGDEYRLVQRFAHFALNSYQAWDNYAFDKVSGKPAEYASAFSEWAKQFGREMYFLPSIAG